ncbi:biopolymer transporter ExbD, partial [Collimonas sp.]|uniref:ExbD/TolR family protein n=1 Tax=Collimonas sp. TaxID=1963772 RepID=UPI002CE403C0
VLIIMLIITIPIQNHAIKLNMPTGNPPPPLALPVVDTVDIDPSGTVMWNGTPMANRAELEDRLKTVVAGGNIDEVHLRPNKAVEYKSVAAVMASAQRLGVTKIGIVGNEQFME